MYRRVLAGMSPLSFYVRHYGSQYFSGLNKKENAPNKSSVYLDYCCCILLKSIFNYVINIYNL